MSAQIKDTRSQKKELRKFGITIGVAFGLLGGLLLWRGKNCYPYFLFLCVVFICAALRSPGLLQPAQKAWMAMSRRLGWVMTRVILIVLFYLVLIPVGILAKLCGKRFLDLKLDGEAESYWIPRAKRQFQGSDYEKQF